MKALILAQHYAPEEVSGAVLATELAEDLASRGHQISFVTCAPNYPHGRVFPGYHNRLLSSEIRNSVRVIRVWSFITPNRGFWKRLLNFGTFSLMSFWGGLISRKPDLIYSYSPPLPLGISAWFLSRFFRVPWILRVEDIFPDAAIATGILKNRIAIHLFRWLEKLLYQKATRISVIAEGFRHNLIAKGVPDEKLAVTPIWADSSAITPQTKYNQFRRANNLKHKFVVLYTGNIGLTTALEDVIEAAALLNDHEEFEFVIIGEGHKKNDLMRMTQRLDLDHVRFLPYQPKNEYPEVLASADLTLVTLNSESSPYSLPYKTFNYLASARPVISIAPPDSDLACLIQEAQCGIVVSPGHPAVLAQVIHSLAQQPESLTEMGQNGRLYLEDKFSRTKCVDQYENLFLSSLFKQKIP